MHAYLPQLDWGHYEVSITARSGHIVKMTPFCTLLCIFMALLQLTSADKYKIVILESKQHHGFEEGFDTALRNSLDYVNNRVLGDTFIQLVVESLVVDPQGIFGNDFLYNPKNKDILQGASVFLLPHYISQVCILGDMLRVPMVTLSYEPNLFCSNMFSMRPDPLIMNQALVTMVRELRPRAVAVVTEVGFGEFATSIMSRDQHLNDFSFQAIGSVNFSRDLSLQAALKDLKESGALTALLMMQQENAYRLLKMASSQKIIAIRNLKWVIPFLDTSNSAALKEFEGFMTLSIPNDSDRYSKLKDFVSVQLAKDARSQNLNPLLHDALTAIAEGYKAFLREKCSEIRKKSTEFCPIRKRPQCKELKDHLSEVLFRGVTGDFKFTKSQFRNITQLDAIEIVRGERYKLGTWSVQCEAFKWNEDSDFKKKQGRTYSCEKEEPKGCSIASQSYQPKRRRLKVVAKVEEPFLFYDPQLKTENPNDRFSGFCKDLLDKLAKDLDFRYDLHLVRDKQYGKREDNASWTGMVGQLIEKEADLAIGALTVTSPRESVIDFTSSFMDFAMAVLMKKPRAQERGYFQCFKPFTFGMWISIIVATLVVAFIMFVIERFSPMGYRKLAQSSPDYSGNEFSVVNSLWFAIASLLQQGPDQTPRSIAGRTLSTSFWFFVTIVMAAYISSLAAYFISAKPESTMSNLEDVVNNGRLLFSALKGGAVSKLLEKSHGPFYRKMYKKVMDSGGFQDSMDTAVKSVREMDLAFIGDQPILEYVNSKLPCDTMTLKHVLQMQSYAFGLPMRSEWTNCISVHMLLLKESGYIQGLRLKWWNEQSECKEKSEVVNTPSSIDFHDMAGLCAILAAGVCLALIFLLLEIKLKNSMINSCSKRGGIARKEQHMLKAPQITYLDYKPNGENYDVSFAKMYGSKYDDKSTLTNSFEEGSKNYREAPESTL